MISNTILPDASMSHPAFTRSFGTESFSFRQFIDTLVKEIPATEITLSTTFPRGGLQLVQPAKVSESFLKAYVREWHAHDDASWSALTSGSPARGKAASRFSEEFLVPFGYRYSAAAVVTDPVLLGYSGVLNIYRGEDLQPFTDDELQLLGEHAEHCPQACARPRRVVL